MGSFTAVAVKAALANPGTYQDGDGLFLKVKKSGGASWMVRVQRDGKRQGIGLGSAKMMTLAEARQKAQEIRKATRVERRDILAERKDEVAAKVTFRQAALQFQSENEGAGKARSMRASGSPLSKTTPLQTSNGLRSMTCSTPRVGDLRS